MRPLIERVLSVLFPVRFHKIKTAEEAREWFYFETPNHHPELDPFRPLGNRDSWAGRKKEYEGVSNASPKHRHAHLAGIHRCEQRDRERKARSTRTGF